jgi:hypothetical protein
MKSILFLAIAVIGLLSTSCKGRDKCSTCPTFSEVDTIDQKQIQY